MCVGSICWLTGCEASQRYVDMLTRCSKPFQLFHPFHLFPFHSDENAVASSKSGPSRRWNTWKLGLLGEESSSVLRSYCGVAVKSTQLGKTEIFLYRGTGDWNADKNSFATELQGFRHMAHFISRLPHFCQTQNENNGRSALFQFHYIFFH